VEAVAAHHEMRQSLQAHAEAIQASASLSSTSVHVWRQKIKCHFVFALKHDGWYKARLVAGGHMTSLTSESAYSIVVSIRSLRLALLAAELNNLSMWAGHIGTAYLEAYTREMVYFVAGRNLEIMKDTPSSS